MNTASHRQPWIRGPLADGLFVLAPAFLVTGAVLLFPGFFDRGAAMPPIAWLILIVGVDVAHVYSTLYRTYFDKEEFSRYRRPLTLIPLLGFAAGVTVYLIDGMLFWRLLAYFAVYHFVRQQYGFFAIYRRKEPSRGPWLRRLDNAVIYAATLYPLLYWHTATPRHFNWFMQGDFLLFDAPVVERIGFFLYLGLLAAYACKEAYFSLKEGGFNFPKNAILLGTVVSWYTGIVLYNGDLAFTATNVVAHGIPYMALIWMYGRKKAEKAPVRRRVSAFFQLRLLPLFAGLLFLFAYVEEWLWDGLVWRDHVNLFPGAEALPLAAGDLALALLVPLLTLPQLTHYLIDGFIWRMRKEDSELKEMVE